MANSGLVDDCHRCLQKGHESWQSYFSKWENLAKREEELPESELFTEPNENVVLPKQQKKKHKRKGPSKKKVNVLLSSLPSSSSYLLRNRSTLRRIKMNINVKKKVAPKSKKKVLPKNKKKVLPKTKKKVLRKNKKTMLPKTKEKILPKGKEETKKIIERFNSVNNDSLPEEDDNGQLEMDLRAIFMNVLKENKNKWEMFSVLSQTYSHGGVTIKGSHTVSSNQHLAVTSNDFKVDSIKLLFEHQGFSSPRNSLRKAYHSSRSFCEPPKQYTILNVSIENQILNQTPVSTRPGFLTDKSLNNQVSVISHNQFQTPLRTVNCELKRPIKSCPGKMFFQTPTNNQSSEGNNTLMPSTLDFGLGHSSRRVWDGENQDFGKNIYLQQSFIKSVQTNNQRRESFQSLCERKHPVSVNMENLNFTTPKGKPSERKCFSQAKRKKGRPSKLSFLDYEEDSDSDDHTENRSPVILWDCKKRKIKDRSLVEKKDSDSDECESILDRVNKN